MKKTILFVAFIIVSCVLYAQSKISHEYAWESNTIDAPATNEIFKSEKAVILKEESLIAFNCPCIRKHLIIRYQSIQGIEQSKTFDLPESFDYIRDKHMASTNRDKPLHCPKIHDGGVKYFAARIKKADGRIVPAVFKDSTESETIVLKGFNKEYYAYFFSIQNIEAGDVVEMVYEYEIPFSYYLAKNKQRISNYSAYLDADLNVVALSRLFFHGKLPKQDYNLRVRFPKRGLYFIKGYNGGSYNDSIETGNTLEYRWQRKNLMGCMEEAGARPYLELPYAQLYFNYKDMLEGTPSEYKIGDYNWLYIGIKMKAFRFTPEEYRRRLRSEDSHAIDDFMQTTLEGTPNTAPNILKLQKLHETVNEKFAYSNDEDFYSGRDIKLEDLDKYIRAKKTLRDISRFNFYKIITDYVIDDYYLCGIADKRVEDIDPGNYRPYLAFNWQYYVPYNNSGIYLAPKKHRFGWHVNELPFYLENVKSIFIPQSIPLDDRHAFHFDLKSLSTPANTFNDNVRKTNVLVNIIKTNTTASFDVMVNLKGQYSTMCRGYYKYGFTDSTSNKKYASYASDIKADHKVVSSTLVNENINFPFDTDFRLKYESADAIKQTSDGYEINLGNWFNHVIPDNFNAENRHLAYYADFSGTDVYHYNLVFDQPVEVLNKEVLEKEIENNYGLYKFHISQPQPNVILLESYYIAKSEYIPATDVQQISDIFNTIYSANKYQLKLKLIN